MKQKSPFLLVPVVLLSLAIVVVVALRADLPTRLAALTERGLRMVTGREAAAPKVEFLAPAERALLDEVNYARAHPQEYAAFVEQLKQTARGNQIKIGAKTYTLQEGLGVLDEAVNFLRAQRPVAPLNAARGLCAGARDHVNDLGLTGETGHRGSDGSLPEQRIERYGSWQTTVGESIAYNSGDAREAVVGMIIDDGVPTRGHRLNIFNPAFAVAGVAWGPPTQHGLMCVITYAGGYADKGAGAAAYRR
ncbi:MAG TPA: CAP domain-containing protein [Pyrinomonadaceae bacterium]|jgi:uncharacterized protein YkwD